MANEAINTYLVGFSSRATNPDFLEEMIEVRKKEARKNLIGTLIYLAFLIAAVVILAAAYIVPEMSVAHAWATGFSVAAIPVFGILFIIKVVLGAFDKVKVDGNDSWDGVVVQREQWTATSTDDRGRTTEYENYRITIEKDGGGQRTLEGGPARVIMPLVAEGDKVRYHTGFPYPVELYDKSKHGMNVCVFCGARNSASNNTCEKCGKLMLI